MPVPYEFNNMPVPYGYGHQIRHINSVPILFGKKMIEEYKKGGGD